MVGDLRFAGIMHAIYRSVETFAALGFVILGATILAQSISVIGLYVLTAITCGEVNIGEAARASVRYWVVMLIGITILTILPGIALFLPSMVF